MAGRPPATFWHLADEVAATAALLGHVRGLWPKVGFAEHDAEVLLVLLATGCEKLAKITLGLLTAETTGSWPSSKRLRGQYSHDVVALDRDCRQLIEQGLPRATHGNVVSGLLENVAADPFLPQLLEAVTVYGKQGRFHHIDHLAGDPKPAASAIEVWIQMVNTAVRAHPRFMELIGVSGDAWNTLRDDTNLRLVDSLAIWQELYAQALVQGLAGRENVAHGIALRSKGLRR